VSPNRTHLVTAPELALALLTTFLTASLLATLVTLLAALVTLLAALPTLLSALSALLTFSAAGFLSTTLTARSLLTSALLTATLIFFTIVCHVFLQWLKVLNANAVFEFENRHPIEPCCIHSKQIAAIALGVKQLEQEECHWPNEAGGPIW
jgi:hypothetical protein